MRSVNRMFQPPRPSASANSKTAHGLPAFVRPIEEQLLQALLCNTVQDTFYADSKEMLEETKRVHAEAIEHDVNFYARALAYGRTRGLMRTQAVYGLALLASRSDLDVPRTYKHKNGGTYTDPLFEQIFDDVIHTPDDLRDFHACVRAIKGNDGGRRVKRVAGSWLHRRMSEYWAIKYGANKAGAFSLRDLYRIYHPAAGHTSELVNYILGKEPGKLNALIKLPQINAFEYLKSAKTSADKVAAIKLGRLPHNVATTFAGKDAAVWVEIVKQMPAFALLRNLATIERRGVLEAVRPLIVEKLTGEGLAKARIFPFVFLQALDHVQDSEIKDALRLGLEICLRGAETIEGKTLVALDISGSMSGILDKAALFAVATARRAAPGSKMILFNEEAHPYTFSRVDSVLTQATSIRRHLGGGTDQGAIVRFLQAYGERFDNIVVVTDEQQQTGAPFADKVAEWRGGKLGKGSKFFVANLAPYTRMGGLLRPGEGNFSVFGLNEAAITFIVKAAQGWNTFVSEVLQGTSAADDLASQLEEVVGDE